MQLEHLDATEILLSQYAAGNLPAPVSVLVESHLELKSENRDFVLQLEAFAGLALEETSPVPLVKHDARLDAIFASDPNIVSDKFLTSSFDQNPDGLPHALRDFLGMDLDDIPWKTKLPGFKEYDMGEIDGCHVNMFWIRAGRSVPAHTHKGCELSIVLDGAFTDERGRFGRGDISIADASIDHRPLADKSGPCIGFAVLDDGLRLTGPFHQLIGDLIG